jgi:hypothetical protein
MGEGGGMAKRIKRVSDLPDWFDLNKYSDAKFLDAAGWYEQLSVRRDIQTMIAAERKPSLETSTFKDVLKRVQITPIVNVLESELLRTCFYDGALHEIKTRNQQYTLGVHLAKVRDLYLAEGHIQQEKRNYARGFFRQIELPLVKHQKRG